MKAERNKNKKMPINNFCHCENVVMNPFFGYGVRAKCKLFPNTVAYSLLGVIIGLKMSFNSSDLVSGLCKVKYRGGHEQSETFTAKMMVSLVDSVSTVDTQLSTLNMLAYLIRHFK